MTSETSELLDRYRPQGQAETADVDRVRALVHTAEDPWLRTIPLHVTASAVIVHPDSGELLLRWHQRQQAWLQVGGHADPGETSPLSIALREAGEETGLTDLVPWPACTVSWPPSNSTSSAPLSTMVNSSNSGRCPGSAHPDGLRM